MGFGGPEHKDDVLPFLENVTRGRGVPRDRLLAVAEHYDHFGGVSPYNPQVRELVQALEPELAGRGITLPIYWGNRNWHPMLEDTLVEMTAGVTRRWRSCWLRIVLTRVAASIAKTSPAPGRGRPRRT